MRPRVLASSAAIDVSTASCSRTTRANHASIGTKTETSAVCASGASGAGTAPSASERGVGHDGYAIRNEQGEHR